MVGAPESICQTDRVKWFRIWCGDPCEPYKSRNEQCEKENDRRRKAQGCKLLSDAYYKVLESYFS